MKRKESRGGHYREDFTEKLDDYGQLNMSVSKNESGEMEVAAITKKTVPDDLKEIIEEFK
jgi:succinate dehydrogenase/fumarate reductase flavoprotein subunit